MTIDEMSYWSRSMEKKLCERVQIALSDPDMLKVLQEFGAEAFRRSSIFHGLAKFLDDNQVRGSTCFEIGTWNGLTTAVLARRFEKVISVDINAGPLRNRICKHLDLKNVLCLDILSNREKWEIAKDVDFDFAYIDGNHEQDTHSDYELVKRCGRVLFHEVWPFQLPVWSLVQSLPAHQVVYGGDGLALWDAARK